MAGLTPFPPELDPIRPASHLFRICPLRVIRVLRVSFSGSEPMKPADADFGVTVEFRKGKSDPVRVFQGLSILLDGFQQFDSVFLRAVDFRIEPIMVLEDVEANTITAWVRNRLRQVDDEAPKGMEWKSRSALLPSKQNTAFCNI